MNGLCPTGCGRHVRPGHLMCGSCWGEVPRDLQRAVYSTWRKVNKDLGDAEGWAEYRAARDAAIASIR